MVVFAKMPQQRCGKNARGVVWRQAMSPPPERRFNRAAFRVVRWRYVTAMRRNRSQTAKKSLSQSLQPMIR